LKTLNSIDPKNYPKEYKTLLTQQAVIVLLPFMTLGQRTRCCSSEARTGSVLYREK